MGITVVLFWFLTALAILSALMVVFSKNPVHSVLWLIAVFFLYLRTLYHTLTHNFLRL
jgi:NADH-quinone oxidoreductase subunit J